VRDSVIVTCEHGGNRVPAAYRAWFRGRLHGVFTHRGYDRGALELARDVARELGAPLHYSTVTRLLVDLNRSVHHRRLHSDALGSAPEESKRRALALYYLPYRKAVEESVAAAIRAGRRVVHLSCHSFTPRLEGERRTADIGLLYDPGRAGEAALCARWKRLLVEADPTLAVRRNYPYRGTDDGLTVHLRRLHGPRKYVGVEIEVNQQKVVDAARWRRLRRVIVETFGRALGSKDEVRTPYGKGVGGAPL
jgi:predicted N-formylglutamate amidohydrolase